MTILNLTKNNISSLIPGKKRCQFMNLVQRLLEETRQKSLFVYQLHVDFWWWVVQLMSGFGHRWVYILRERRVPSILSLLWPNFWQQQSPVSGKFYMCGFMTPSSLIIFKISHKCIRRCRRQNDIYVLWPIKDRFFDWGFSSINSIVTIDK